MTGLGAAPGPEYYLTPGDPVTCLSLRHARLVAGLATGEIVSYDTNTWREQNRQKVFDRGGLLWLDVVELEGARRLVAQGRFEGVKVLDVEDERWSEVASFSIPHSGFCAGYLHQLQSDLLMIVASDTSKVLVSKLWRTFIRPLSRLLKEKAGTVISVSQAQLETGKLVAGYESGEVVLWDWTNNIQLLSVGLAEHVGTLMSLTWDMDKMLGVVVGSDNKVLVIDEELKLLKAREVTNSGLSSVMVRGDGKLVVTGGWDGRLRLFSWLKPRNLKPLAVLQFHQEAVESLISSCSDSKQLIVAGGKDGKISVWDIY